MINCLPLSREDYIQHWKTVFILKTWFCLMVSGQLKHEIYGESVDFGAFISNVESQRE